MTGGTYIYSAGRFRIVCTVPAVPTDLLNYLNIRLIGGALMLNISILLIVINSTMVTVGVD